MVAAIMLHGLVTCTVGHRYRNIGSKIPYGTYRNIGSKYPTVVIVSLGVEYPTVVIANCLLRIDTLPFTLPTHFYIFITMYFLWS